MSFQPTTVKAIVHSCVAAIWTFWIYHLSRGGRIRGGGKSRL